MRTAGSVVYTCTTYIFMSLDEVACATRKSVQVGLVDADEPSG